MTPRRLPHAHRAEEPLTPGQVAGFLVGLLLVVVGLIFWMATGGYPS